MIALHHVQVACPPGGEDAARRFYADGLGLTEVEKPADLAGRGGAWFRAYDARARSAPSSTSASRSPFAPARKAHPAFVVDDLEAVAARSRGRLSTSTGASAHTFAGYQRFHIRDPHGNRVEVLQPRD